MNHPTIHSSLKLVSTFFLVLIVHSAAMGGAVESVDDILFWVGEGENSAALVVDWNGHNDQNISLTWGFRWDGTATGEDMLVAILQEDSRLYSKLGTFGSQTAVYGIGYEANGDGQFELDDETQFDSSGIAQTSPADGSTPINGNDWYSEGWFLGYWYHAISSTDGNAPATWSPGSGLTARTLANGDWGSLAYKDTTDPILAAPSRLHAAEDTRQPGDYNRDGQIDAGDFTVWRDNLGNAPLLPGYGADGDFDGATGNSDYGVWLTAFSDQSSTPPNVPEPNTGILLLWMALFFPNLFKSKRRRN